MRIAAEKIRLKKEQEEKEDREFYERITSGWQWNLFKFVVVFCTLMAILTTIEFLFEGKTRKLAKNEWKYDSEWRMEWHHIVVVDGARFVPHFRDWSDRVEGSFEITYTPIFQTAKLLSYSLKDEETGAVRRHTEYRWRSLLGWFPFFQLFALIPLATFFYKRQNSFFNFARVASLSMVFPGTLIAIYFLIF